MQMARPQCVTPLVFVWEVGWEQGTWFICLAAFLIGNNKGVRQDVWGLNWDPLA
jgi:hypothetical protein